MQYFLRQVNILNISVVVKQINKFQAVLSIILITLFSQNMVLAQDAGPNKFITCDNTILSASGGPGVWSTLVPGVLFSNTADPNATVSVLPAGANILTWTVAGTPYDVTITRELANAGPDQPNTCGSTILAGNSVIGASGLWTSLPADVTFSDATAANATVSNIPAGATRTLTWEITIEGCNTSDVVLITNITPTGITAGPDVEVCTNNTYSLAANLGTGISGSWSITTGSGVFDNSTSPTATVSSLANGVNNLRWTVVNGACSTYDDITLTNNTVTATASNQTVCETTANFDGNLPVGTSGVWTKVPGGAPAIIADNTLATSGVSNLQVGANTFTWTLTKGTCTDPVTITITRNLLSANAGPDQNSVCATFTNLNATPVVLPEIGTWSLVAGSGTFSNSNLATAVVSGLDASTPNIFRWTVSLAGCTSVSDEVTITSNALPVNAGTDSTGVCGTSVTINATSGDPTGSGGSGVWSTVTTANILTPSNYTSLVTSLPPATSTFRWTVTKNGCSVWDEVQITRSAYAANAGVDQSVCGTSAVLSGSDPGPGGSGAWTVQSGVGTITSPLSRNTTVTNITSFPLVVRWTLTGGACSGEFDEVTISSQGTTVADIIGAPSIDVTCSNNFHNNLTATNAPGGGETLTWYEAAPTTGVTFTAPNAQTTDVNNLTVPGAHTIVLEITDGVCTNLDTVVLNTYSINPALFPSFPNVAGPDQGNGATCQEYFTLAADPPVVPYTGTWSVISPSNSENVYFEDPNAYNTRIKTYDDAAKDSDTFTLTWTLTNGSCTLSDDVVIQNNYTAFAALNTATPGYTFGDKDIYLCSSTILDLDGHPRTNNSNDGGWEIPANYGTAFEFNGGAGNVNCVPNTGINTRHKNFDAQLSIDGQLGDFILIWHQCGGPTSGACDSRDSLFFHVQLDMTNGVAVNAAGGVEYYTAGGAKLPFAGPDQNICGTTATMSAVDPATDGLINTSGYWTPVGSETYANINDPSTTVSGLSVGANTLTWTVTNGCSSVSDQVTINVSSVTGTDAGPDQTICDDFATFAADVAPIGGSGTWSVKSGGGIVADPTLNTSGVTSLLHGRNVFLWSVTSPFCNAVDSVVIYSGKPATPDAGPDQTFCGSGNMQGIPPALGTAQWSVISGGATITSPNDPNSNVTPLVSPSTLRWTVTEVAPNALQCTSYDDVIVIDNTPQTAVATAVPFPVCVSTGLAANSPALGETGLWKVIVGTGTFDDNTAAITNVNGLNLGVNTLRWTLTKGACTSSDDVDITSQGINANITTPDQTTCLTDIALIATDPAPGTGVWAPFGTSATIADPTAFGTTATGMDTDATNQFTWTVTYGACVDQDILTVVNASVTTANAGADQNVCTGTATMSGNLPNYAAGETGTWSTLVPGVTFDNATNVNAVASNIPGGSNTFTWTIDNGACSTSDDVIINVNNYSVEAGNPQTICVDNTTLNGSNPAPGTGLWTLQSGTGAFTTPNSSTTNVTGITSTINVYRWTVTQGICVYQDDVTVTLNSPTTSNAGPDQIICTDATTLDADPVSIGIGTWTSSSGGVIIADPTFYQSAVSNLPPGGTTFTWTVTNAACTSIDQVLISNNAFTTGAGVPQVLCTNTTTLDGINPGTGSGVWTVRSGSGTFTDPTYYRTTVTNIGRGDNIYRWTVTGGTCTEFAEVTISNYSVTANAGLDDYTCDGTYQLQGNNPTTQDIAIPNLPATGTWTTPGPSIIANINLYNTNVTGLNPDANIFRWTIDNGTCSDFDEVIISNDMPTVPNAGPDDIFCGIDFGPSGYNSIYNSLTANSPDYTKNGIGETGVWTQVAGTSTFLDANTTLNLRVDDLELYAQLSGPNFWNLNPTVNTYRWTITYKLCSLYDEVTITNAAPDSAHAGPDQTVCWDNADLNATDLGDYAQLHWWTATPPGTITFEDPLTSAIVTPFDMPFNSHVENLQVGTTTFRWSKENTLSIPVPLKTVTCTIWDEMDVTRVASNLGTTSAGPNQIVCSRDALMQGSPPDAAFVAPPVYDVTGEWSIISGGGTFANASSNSTLVTNLNYDTNVLRWTLTNNTLGCIITNDVYITNALPSNANAGPDQNVCTNTALLSAERPTRGVGTWSVIGGGGTISNTTCVSFNCNVYVSNLSTGQNTFLWTTSNTYTDPASGDTKTCELTDEIEVWNNSVTAEAGLDQTVCIDDATLAATDPGAGESGVWVRTGGSATVTNPTLYNTTVTGLSPDINTFRWTLSNAFCSDFDLMTITNNNPTDPVASTPITDICTDVAPINGNNPLNGTGQWSISAGGGVITNASLASTTVTGIPGGVINTYTWTITKNGCPESADVSINNRSVTADAGIDIDNVCGVEPAISTVSLDATSPNFIAGESGLWTIVSSAGTILNTNSFNSVVNNMDNGTNTFRWTISNATCSDSDDVDVFVYIPTTSVTNPDYEACADLTDIEVLTANPPDPGRGIGTWTLVSGGAAIADNTANVSNVTNLGFNENRFRWTIDHNGCTSTDDIIITNNFVSSNAGPDDAICTDTYTLSGNDPTINDVVGFAQASGQWSVTQGTGVFVDDTQFDTDVSGLSTAVTNILRWTLTKGGCSDWDEVSIINNEFITSANVDQTVCNNFTTLNGQQPGVGETGVWNVDLGAGGFVDNTLYNTQVNGLAVGSNIIRWTVSNANCSATDAMEVYYNYVTSNAGSLDRVCTTTYPNLDGNIPPGTASGNWVALLGGATVTTPTLYNSGVTNLGTGQNTFQWTVSNTVNTVTCNAVSTVDIFNDTPTTANVEPDNEVCTNSTLLSVLTIPTIGMGVWTAVDNVATFDNSLGLNATVTGLKLKDNTFRWTVTNQACTSTDDVIITNSTVIADAGTDESSNCQDTIVLDGNNLAITQGSGVWTQLSGVGTVSIVSPTLHNTEVTGLGSGVNRETQFRWTVTQGGCIATDDVAINNYSVTATATDKTTCDGTAILDGNDPALYGGGYTGLWTKTVPTSPGTIVNSTLYNTQVTGIPNETTVSFTWTINGFGCGDSKSITVRNNNFTVSAGIPQTLCSNSTTLAGDDPAPGTGLWTLVGGAGAATIPTLSNSVVTGLNPDDNIFRWTITKNGCSSSGDVTLTNNQPTTAVIALPLPANREICTNTAIIQGNNPLQGTGLWTASTAATFVDATNFSTTVNNLASGANILTWSITKGTCPSSDATMTLTNNEVLAQAGADQNLCDNFTNLVAINPTSVPPSQGTGVWTRTVGTGIIANSILNTTGVSNLSSGVNTFRWTVTQGICSTFDDVNINHNGITATATDKTACTGTVTLDGNIIPGASGLWTESPAGPGTITDPTLGTTTVTGIPNESTLSYTWTVTLGACSDNITIAATNNNFALSAGPDLTVCGPTYTMVGDDPSPGTGLWTLSGGAGSITTPTLNITGITGLGSGANTFTWTVTKNGCTNPANVVITNDSPTTASIVLPLIGNREICTNSAIIQGNNPVVGTGLWTASTAATFVDATNFSTTVNNLAPGANILTWSITQGTCASSDATMTLTNNEVLAQAGSDQNLCDNFTSLVAIDPTSVPPSQGTGVWTRTVGTGIIANSILNTTGVSNLSSGVNTFRWTVTEGICSDFDDVNINHNGITATATDKTACVGTVTLDGNIIPGASGLWTESPAGPGTITDPTLGTTTVTGIPNETTLSYTWTVTLGACSDNITIATTNNNFALSAGPDLTVCGPTHTMAGDDPAPGTGLWTLSGGSGSITTPTLNTTGITGLGSGANTFTWTVTRNGCTNPANVVITNDSPTTATIALPLIGNREICTNTAIIQGNNPVVGTGLWTASTAATFVDATNFSTTVNNLAPGANILTWSITNGTCASSDATMTLTNNEVLAQAGSDQNLCDNFTSLVAIDPTSVPPSQGTGVWTRTVGTGIIANSILNTTGVSNLSSGVNTFRWTVTQGICSTFDDVNINHNGITATATDKTACVGTVTLDGNIIPGASGLWTEAPAGPGTITDPTLGTTTVTGIPNETTLSYTWTVTLGACSDNITIAATNNNFALSAGPDLTVCGPTHTMAGDDPAPGTGLWTLSGGSGSITTPTLNTTGITGLGSGANTFTWTVTRNGCTNPANVVITNDSPTTATIALPLIGNREICTNTAIIQGNNPVVGTGLWTASTGATFVNATNFSTTVNNLAPGTNDITWSITNGTCPSSDATMTLTNNEVLAQAGPDQNLCDNFTNLAAIDPTSVPPSQGTGAWTRTVGTGILANSLSIASGVSNLSSGVNTFRWTVTQGICSTFDDVTINHNGITATATDKTACTGTVTLDGNIIPGATGLWTETPAGPGTITDPTLGTTTVTGIPDETTLSYTWTVTLGSCSNDITIQATNNNFALSAGANQTVCTNSATLGAQNIGTGYWQVIAGSAIFTSSIDPGTTVSSLGPDNNIFRWTVTNNGCSNFADVTINNRTVSANVIANTIDVCSSNATLNALDPSPNSGLWTIVSGTATINTPTFYNSTVDITGSSATFKWTVTNESCSASETVSVNDNSITLNGSTKPTCFFIETLNAGPLSGGQTGAWTSASTNPIIQNSTNPSTSVSNLDFGTNVFFWTVTTATGCVATAQHDIVNNSPSTSNAGVDQNICVDNTILSANNPLYGSGTWTQVGGTTTGVVIADPTNNSTAVTGLDIGSSTFRWTITYNGCTDQDEVTINNNSFVLSAGVDETLCGSATAFAADAVPGGGSGQWQLVGGAGVITASNSNVSAVTGLGQGTNTFRWTVTNALACTVSDEVQITNNQPSVPNVSADQTTCASSITISGDAPPVNATGTWSLGAGSATIVNANSNVTLVTGLSDNNQFIWTIDKFGCTASNTVTITYNGVTASANDNFSTCNDFADLKATNPVAGTGAWTLQSGTGVIANSTAFETTVSGLSQGINVFRWTVTRSSCTADDDITITNNAPDVADAGTTINTCNATFSLLGNDPVIGSGTWTKSVGSTATITDPTLYNTSVNMPIAAMPYSELFTWTIANGVCSSNDAVTVNNNAFIVYANADDYTCDGTYPMLGRDPLTVSGTATGNWTVITGSGIFDNSLAYNATVSGLNPGVNSYRWTINDNGCTGYDDVVITNDEVTASGTGFMTCVDNASITANNPVLQSATGAWTVDNQTTQVVTNPTSFTTAVSGLVPNAINSFRWTVTRNACSVSDTLNVEYYVPNANITIPDIAHGCSDTIQLIADPNLGTGSGVWAEKFGSFQVTIDDNTATTTIARNLEIKDNVFVWTVTDRGCTSTDEVSINNSKPINTAGSDWAGCNNTFTMNAEVPTATGSGLWSLISGTVSFTDPTLATTTVTASPGANIVQWTITDNGCTSSKQFTVTNNLTSPNAGTDVAVCENRVNLSGSSLKSGESGVWSIDGAVGSEVFSSTTVRNPEVTSLRQGIITFVWTVTNGICTAEDRVVVTNNTPTVDAGSDRAICEDFVTLAGNNPDIGDNGVWSIGNINVTILSPTAYNTNVTNLSQGSNLFTWTVDNGLCVASDDVLITSNAINVVAGIPYTEDCADTLYLEATVPPIGASGAWIAVVGGGTFDNATSYTTIARNLGSFNKLRWTITVGACSFYDEIDFVSLLPTQAIAPIDKAVCNSTTQITANPENTGLGESGLWTKVVGSAGVIIVDPTAFQTDVTNLDPGVNVFQWTISNASCNTSDQITITNNQVFADAGNDQITCDSSSTISANVITGTGTWATTTPGVVIANSSSPNSAVSSLAFENNNFQWTVTYNGCSDVDEVIITSNLPRNVSAGADQNICSGSTNLSGSNPGIGTGLWTLTGSAGAFADPTANQTLVSGLFSGENSFTWTVTVGACSKSDQVSIHNNSLYVTAGTDQTLCNLDTLVLDGTQPGSGITGVWSVSGGSGTFDAPTEFNSTVRALTKGTNTFVWTLTDGSCTNFAEVEVIVNTPDSAKVGADQFICADNSTVNAVAVSNGAGIWSLKSGSGVFTDPLSNNTTVSEINVGLNTYTWTVTKNACSLAADIDITNNSVIAYIANKDIVICTPTHATTIIGNSIGSGETGYWTKISAGPGVITTSTSNVTTVTALGNGETYFRWSVANGSCSNTDDLRITNNYYNTTANAAGPTTLCVDYSPIIGGSLPIGATGKWTSTAPDVTFDDDTQVSTVARSLPNGTSAITWTVTKDGCSSPASFTLLNNAIYTSAGADQVVCQTTTNLNAQGLLGGETGSWTVNNGSVVIANTADPVSAVSGLITGDNTFTWTLNGNGCTVTEDVIISNNAFSVTAGVDQIECGTSFSLAGSDPLTGTGLWSVSSGTGRFIDATNFETTVEDMNNGPNTFTWTVNRNGCVAFDDVIITNDLYIAVAGADRSICSDQTTVSAQPLNPSWGASGLWTAQTGGGVFANPPLESSLVTGLSSGDNRLRWTITKGTCVSFDEIIITNNSFSGSAGTDETTCNDFVSLNATPLSATGTGLWTGGGVTATIVTPTSASTSVIDLQQGVNTFAWTVTDNGCTGTSTVKITSNKFVADAGILQNLPVNSATMTATVPPTASGIWSTKGGTGTIAVLNDPISVVTNLGNGVNEFNWEVTWNGCTESDTVVLIFNSITADAGIDTTVCVDRLNLYAANPFPGTGAWTVASGAGVFTNPNSESTEVTGILPNSVNVYTWTVEINGYSESDDVVVINAEFSITAGGDDETCDNFYTMGAEPAGKGTGTWSVLAGSGSFTDLNSPTSYVSNLDGIIPNQFVWMVVQPTGCVDSDTIEIIYNVPPIAAFETTPSSGCSPIDIEFKNTSVNGNYYYWYFGDDQQTDSSLTSFTRTYEAVYDADSTYTTTLITYSAAGCSDTISHQVTAFRIPKVNFSAFPSLQVYPDATVSVENLSGDGYPNYYWTYGDGNTRLDNSLVQSFGHTYDTWGEYEITLAVASDNCSDTARQTITILPREPTNNGGRNYSGCQPLTVNLSASTLYADRYAWYFSGGEGSSSEENPTRIFETADIYYAELRAWGPGGDSVLVRTDTITVYPVPHADMLVTPDTVMLPNQPIHCYNRSTFGDTFNWEFGDTSAISTDENPIHYYTEVGEYSVTLRVYTENGCFDDTTSNYPVIVEKAGVCEFPNAFSPNPSGGSGGRWKQDDVSNDIFHPVHRGVLEYKLEIFNRWGEKIFESLEPGIGWDGYVRGRLAPQDVYVWKVTGKYKNGVIFKNAGDVTLMR